MSEPVTSTFKDSTGRTYEVPADQLGGALAAGLTPESSGERTDRLAGDVQHETYGGVGGGVLATVAGVARGATLGASDAIISAAGGRQALKGLTDENPNLSTAGNIVGAVAPALLGDEAGLASLTPAGLTSRLGARIAERTGGGLIGTVAAGAAEGSLYNAGAYVSDVALGNRDLSAEGFVGAMGKGAFYGGVGAGALSVASNGLIAARRLFPLAESTPEAVAVAKLGAKRAIGDSIDTSSGLERTGQQAVTQTDRETQQFITDLEQERSAGLKQAADMRTAQEAPNLRLVRDPVVGEPAAIGETPAIREATAVGEPAATDAATQAGATQAPVEVPAATEVPKSAAVPAKNAKELIKSWREKFPDGAVEYDAANAASRRQRLSDWAKDFEAKTPEDETIKAYFSDPMDPGRTAPGDRLGDIQAPKAVQQVARQNAAIASHDAYAAATAEGANVSTSGVELMARATYAGRKAAAQAMDDVYAAYAAGKPIVDIRAAATQRLSGQLHELAEARVDMIKSLAKQPADLTEQLKATLTSMKPVDPNQPMSMVERAGGEKLSLGQRIIKGVDKPIDPDAAVENALAKSKDVNEDISDIAPKITRYEAAKASLTDALGDSASQQAKDHAAQFRAAQEHAANQNAANTARDIDHLDAADRGVPATALPHGKSMIGGLAKRASDVGTMYEALRALGVPLPDPKNIPVIGPILSMYLKAKIAGKLLGNHGGSFAATAEGTIAAKAVETQNRINGAMGRMLNNTADRLASKAPDIGGAAALGFKLFDAGTAKKAYSSEPDKGDIGALYTQRLGELAASQQPDAIAQAVKQRVNTSDPTILNAIIAAETNKLTYLYNQAPKPDGVPLPGQAAVLPSKAEMVAFGHVLAASHDPSAIFERVADGGVARTAEIDCVKNCYPQLYAQAQQKLVEMLGREGKMPSYMRRVAISSLTGLPMDSTMKPDHAAYLQASNAAVASTQSAPHPTLTSSMSIGDRTMTRLDR